MIRAWPPTTLGLVLTVTALLAAPLPARTEPTVIYRCTAPDGEVTFQNGTPCAAGHQQQRRVIDIAAPLPAFVPAPAAPARAPAVPLPRPERGGTPAVPARCRRAAAPRCGRG